MRMNGYQKETILNELATIKERSPFYAQKY